jgi:hypothetical protein
MKNCLITFITSLLLIGSTAQAFVAASPTPKKKMAMKNVLKAIMADSIDREDEAGVKTYLGSQKKNGRIEVYFLNNQENVIYRWTERSGERAFIDLHNRELIGFGSTKGQNVTALVRYQSGQKQLERFSKHGQRIAHMPLDFDEEQFERFRVSYENPFFFISHSNKSFQAHKWKQGQLESKRGRPLRNGHGFVETMTTYHDVTIRLSDGDYDSRTTEVIYENNNISHLKAIFQGSKNRLFLIVEELQDDLREREGQVLYRIIELNLPDLSLVKESYATLMFKYGVDHHFWVDRDNQLYVTTIDDDGISVSEEVLNN